MTIPKQGHIAVVPLAGWGHLRPVMHLSVQLLILHPDLNITLLLAPSASPRAHKELASSAFSQARRPSASAEASQTSSGSTTPSTIAAPLDRLQLIDVTSDELKSGDNAWTETMKDDNVLYAMALPGFFESLINKEKEIPGHQENRFTNIAPSCVVYDLFHSYVPDAVEKTYKAANKEMVPLLGFVPCCSSALVDHFGKGEYTGLCETLLVSIEKGRKAGKSTGDILAAAGFGDHGRIQKLPGLPAMTDYEIHPGLGAFPPPPQVLEAVVGTHSAAWDPRTKGFICPTTQELEEEAKAYCDQMFGKPVHMVGMQYPEQIWDSKIEPPLTSDQDAVEALAFLDKMKVKHGDKSVIYVSFGSVWFPIARPQLVTHILDTLMQAGYPFLFAYATEIFPVPPELFKSIENYPDGKAVRVAPQIAVLHHPATGVFLSHCGSNSTSEAIVAGVPIVAMPFGADQGEFAHGLVKHGAGIDLKQVKTFHGANPSTFPTTLYDGTKLVGTDDAIKEEMLDLWRKLQHDGLREKLTEGMQGVRKVCNESRLNGCSKAEMEGLSRYF